MRNENALRTGVVIGGIKLSHSTYPTSTHQLRARLISADHQHDTLHVGLEVRRGGGGGLQKCASCQYFRDVELFRAHGGCHGHIYRGWSSRVLSSGGTKSAKPWRRPQETYKMQQSVNQQPPLCHPLR